MQFKVKGKIIYLDKKIDSLDFFVKEFVSVLDKLNIDYVIISGYIAILFGRSRNTEDVDFFINRLSLEKFTLVWRTLIQKYECLNTKDFNDAYDYLVNGSGLRFSREGEYIPNIELKFVKTSLDIFCLNNKLIIEVNQEYRINTSVLELQIAFKLYLGSDKDLEDARHLWIFFRKYLNMEEIIHFCNELKVKVEVIDRIVR
ncbi:MAG: hypothetical protein AABX08_03720 [Nanoarchaeota archaeon]